MDSRERACRFRCWAFGHSYRITVGAVDAMWCDRCGEVFESREGSGVIVIEDWPR